MRSKAPRSRKTKAAAEPTPAIYYRIHALLHTMHAIERFEDHLCSLMHEIQSSGSVSPVISAELRELLADIPSHEYQDDLNAIGEALAPPVPKAAAKTRTAARKESVKRAKAVVKKSAAAKRG